MSAFLPRPLAVRHTKALASIAKRLGDLSADWSDLDACFEGEFTDLAERCEVLRTQLVEVYPGRTKRAAPTPSTTHQQRA